MIMTPEVFKAMNFIRMSDAFLHTGASCLFWLKDQSKENTISGIFELKIKTFGVFVSFS